MINELGIHYFKGIRHGTIDGMSDVNIFVGPNNAGKSTVLDSIYLLSNMFDVNDPIGNHIPDYIMAKKGGVPHREALHYKYEIDTTIGFNIAFDDGLFTESVEFSKGIWQLPSEISSVEQWIEEDEKLVKEFSAANTRRTSSNIEPQLERVNVSARQREIINQLEKNFSKSLYFHSGVFEYLSEVEKEVWENLVHDRSDKKVINYLNRVYDTDVEQLTFIPLENNHELRVLFDDYSSRIDSLGDGFRYMFSLIAAIEAFDANTILVEEPENAQHPKTYDEISKILTNYTTEHGLQTFIATHSYEMIDSLLESCEDTDTEVSIYHLNLEDGHLETRLLDAPDVEVLEDLGIDPRRLKEYE